MQPSRFVKLQIGLSETKRSKYVIALRTTAEYYGWTEQFPIWRPQDAVTSGGRTYFRDPGRRWDPQVAGGIRHRISRSPSTAGQPAGLTNAFRVSSSCTMFDLAELAYFTQGDWYWMEGPNGERISRDRWIAIWHSNNSRAERGLVSE